MENEFLLLTKNVLEVSAASTDEAPAVNSRRLLGAN